MKAERAEVSFECWGTATTEIDSLDRFSLFKKTMSRPELIAPPEIVGWLHILLISSIGLIPPRTVLWRHRIQKIHKQVSCVADITSRLSSTKAFSSTRIQQIQADMTYRALELLSMPPGQPAFLLDIGCGSGLSGEILDDEGYIWAGVDIAPSMLGEFFFLFRLPRGKYDNIEIQFVEEVALEREVEGDLFLQDIGQGFGFRPGSFDGAIRYPSHQCPQMSI